MWAVKNELEDGTLTLVGHLVNSLTILTDGDLADATGNVIDSTPVGTPGQKGLQISVELKLRLKMIKINAVERRLRRQGVKFCL